MFPDTFNCRWTGLYWLRQSLRRPRRGSWKSDQHTAGAETEGRALCREATASCREQAGCPLCGFQQLRALEFFFRG